jgi:hypothetical protein
MSEGSPKDQPRTTDKDNDRSRNQEPQNGRAACSECSRRKQKCNREWPCNQCQRRRIPDQCRFPSLSSPSGDKRSRSHVRKRKTGHQDAGGRYDANWDADNETKIKLEDGQAAVVSDSAEDTPGFEAVGYMMANMFASLGPLTAQTPRSAPKQYWARPDDCPQLARALEALPKREHTDSLIQIFLGTVNFHYYLVYPPVFVREYQSWWDDKAKGRPLGVQWTCLLLMVCAVTTQHLDVSTRRKLELDWGEKTQKLSQRYHSLSRELSSVVPMNYHHMYNIQQLLHTCYWHKAEAQFLECWHVLSTTVREAQELGLHKAPLTEETSYYDQEMQRRIWCIIDTWDWQVSSGLGRPLIIDRSDCTVELPTLALETYSPSPVLYMKMQSELIRDLAARFQAPKYVTSPEQVLEYKGMVEDWMRSFPQVYAFENPDRSSDAQHPWIPFHRYYLYTMAYLLICNPIRSYMAQVYTRSSDPRHLEIRRVGLAYSLKQIMSLKEWIDHITRRDGRFHFIIFSILDTGAVLCTAIINDADQSIPAQTRDDIYEAIDDSVRMLKRLTTLSITAKTSHDILDRLAQRVPRRQIPLDEAHRKKRNIAAHPEPSVPELAPGLDSGIGNPDMMNQMLQLFQYGHVSSTSPESFNNGYDVSTDMSSAPVLSDGFNHGSSTSQSGDSQSATSVTPEYGSIAHHPSPPQAGMPAASVPAYVVEPSVAEVQFLPGLGYGTMSEAELAEVAAMWEWQQGPLGAQYRSAF